MRVAAAPGGEQISAVDGPPSVAVGPPHVANGMVDELVITER